MKIIGLKPMKALFSRLMKSNYQLDIKNPVSAIFHHGVNIVYPR